MPIKMHPKPGAARAANPDKVALTSAALSGNFLKLPTTLTHYTNVRGLIGILDTGEIWASNVSFLNDRRELLYGVDAAAKVIKKFSSKRVYADWHKALDWSLNRLKGGRIPNTYAACFCQKSDLLSQWRGYGGTEQGIAITFKRSALSDAIAHSKATLFPVIYGQLQTADQITKELGDRLDKLNEAASLDSYTEADRREKAYSLLSQLLPQFKHIGFQDEQEWRIVIQHQTLRSGVSFRANANVVVPYLKLKLNHGGKIPFSYIRIGPGRDQELTKQSVELYLKAKEYEDIEVRLSSVPYRFQSSGRANWAGKGTDFAKYSGRCAARKFCSLTSPPTRAGTGKASQQREGRALSGRRAGGLARRSIREGGHGRDVGEI